MINVIERDAYFPPHKHEAPDKREVFIILKGIVLAVEFDDTGQIKDYIILDPEIGNFGVEIPSGKWHSLIPLAEESILYEIKDGPYDEETDKTFAEWAPLEASKNAGGFAAKVL